MTWNSFLSSVDEALHRYADSVGVVRVKNSDIDTLEKFLKISMLNMYKHNDNKQLLLNKIFLEIETLTNFIFLH